MRKLEGTAGVRPRGQGGAGGEQHIEEDVLGRESGRWKAACPEATTAGNGQGARTRGPPHTRPMSPYAGIYSFHWYNNIRQLRTITITCSVPKFSCI